MQRVIAWWAAGVATFVLATTIHGCIHFYSPVPFWDQWDDTGSIGFYRAVWNGDYGNLWAQHMEHRIALARLLFWLDIAVFGGLGVFAVAANLALVAALSWVIAHEYRRGRAAEHPPLLVGGLIAGGLFCWAQQENLTWAFQSQSFLIYLFAMLAFAQFSRPGRRAPRVAASLAFCVLATLSMGNGLLTFGMVAGQAVLLRRPVKEILVPILAGCAAGLVYFTGYQTPVLTVDPDAAKVRFIQLKYVAAFLGNPIYRIHPDLRLAVVAGALVIAVAAALAVRACCRQRVTPYRSFLLAGCGLVGVSALAAAHGRWMLGLVFATSSRYTTPVLLLYVLLALLALDVAPPGRFRFAARIAAALVPTVLALAQVGTWGNNSYLFMRKAAVLAQRIGIDHPSLDGTIFPPGMHDMLIGNAAFAQSRQIGPYATGWLHDAGLVRFDPAKVDGSLCAGFLDRAEPDEAGIAAYGWAVAKPYNRSDILIVLTEASGATVGYGLTGMRRTDLAKLVPGAGSASGWMGFAKPASGTLSAYAYVDEKFCPLPRSR